MENSEIMAKIKSLTKEYFENQERGFVAGQTKVQLSPLYNWEEAAEAIDSLLTTYVTMGKKVKQFEEIFSDYIGVKHGVMVNSGSSANLIALSVLTNPNTKDRIMPGQEVITPATTWSTTVFPIANVGLKPVLVDVDLETYDMNIEQTRKAMSGKTSAIMPVHLLGNPCEMDEIMEMAQEKDLYVLEDSCEAHGAEYKGKKVGSIGDIGTYSFFMSHHITTIEGGMVMTDDEDFAEMARALRVFGWIRDLKKKDEIASKYSFIDKRFLFTTPGYNLRPTEISGAFGIQQMKKLEHSLKVRSENAKYWNKELAEFSEYLILPEERPGTKHAWFGYPVTVKTEAPFTREDLVNFLEDRKIETRPIMAGNIEEQPAMREISHRVVGDLKNSRMILRRSMLWGNHQKIGKQEREYVTNVVREFMEKY